MTARLAPESAERTRSWTALLIQLCEVVGVDLRQTAPEFQTRSRTCNL